MREIGISPRFSRDKFVPLQTKQRYSTRDISGEVFLTLFFRGFVPFLSLADFVSRNKKLQVADLQRLKSCFEELVTATTSNHQKGPCEPVNVASHRNSLVWNITSSISSSRMSMPKSDKILSAIRYWILEEIFVCSVLGSISCTGNRPSAFSRAWISNLSFCVHRVRPTVLPFSGSAMSLPACPKYLAAFLALNSTLPSSR